MKRLQAYRYQLRTNGDQQRQMSRLAGSCRFVWNRMFALQKQRLDAGEPVLRYNQAALLRSLVGIPFSSPHNMRARSEGGEDVKRGIPNKAVFSLYLIPRRQVLHGIVWLN